jgi:perosamine synthetase
MIPMSSPDITDVEREAVAGVLATPDLSMGPCLEAFERAIAGYVGASHAIGVSSGTAALHLALIAAGVGEGDLVLTTPFSFIATANAILYAGARPVFVDVDRDTGNMDPLLAGYALSCAQAHHSRRISAILPAHVFGQPADMDAIMDVAHRYGLRVIEDACEALGSEYKGRKAGSLGSDLATFAFYPNKQITTGEGGMIVTGDGKRADLCRSLRNHGRAGPLARHVRLGYNYRLDEMSAALGLAQMTRIEELLAKRERVAGWYNERLAGLELVQRPVIAPTTTRMSWFVYVVRILPPAKRSEIMAALAAKGIPSRVYFTPIHLQPFYRQQFDYGRGYCPVAEHLGDVSLGLPFSSVMTEGQVDEVCQALKAALP